MYSFSVKFQRVLLRSLYKHLSVPRPYVVKRNGSTDISSTKTEKDYFVSTNYYKQKGMNRIDTLDAKLKRSPIIKSTSAPVDMSGELAQYVQDTIKQDQVVIFSKTYCPYCTMAKDVFQKIHKSYTVVELDKRDDGNKIQDILKELTGARTVPRVFLNGECIGGGTDVQALYDNGTLQNLLISKV